MSTNGNEEQDTSDLSIVKHKMSKKGFSDYLTILVSTLTVD